jgi:hypothetical protein
MSTEPEMIQGDIRLEGDISPVLAILCGYDGRNLVVADISAEGGIHVADTGAGLDGYEVFSGTATDTATALGVDAQSSQVTIEVETFDLTIAFQNSAGGWGADIDLSIGWHSWDFSFQDIRIDNETTLSNSVYQIIVMR